MNVVARINLILVQRRFNVNVQRIFRHSDIQNASLTSDRELNSLIQAMERFSVNTKYRSYKLLKTVRVLAHPVYTHGICR